MAIVFNNQNNSIGLGSTNSSGFTTSITINSTGVGIGTTNPTSKLWVDGDGFFTGILTANRIFSSQYGEFVGGSISGTEIVGTALSISGISTFSNGPIFIGSGTSTGTTSQPLQVTGGAYVSGSVGIGTTNPTSTLQVQGTVSVSSTTTSAEFVGGGSDLRNLSGTHLVSYTSASDISNSALSIAGISTYNQVGILTGSLAVDSSDLFGSSVATSADGKTIIVGAFSDETGATTDTGVVYVFDRVGNSFNQVGILTGSLAVDSSDLFGSSVATSADGKTIIVAARNDEIGAALSTGVVYVFDRVGNSFNQVGILTGSLAVTTNDNFGFNVTTSADGKTIIVGAPSDEIGAALSTGVVYVFDRVGNSFNQVGILTGSLAVTANDLFGSSVATSADGKTIIVGARNDEIGATLGTGVVYVFDRVGNSFNQVGILTGSLAVDVSDNFGYSVATSADGKTIIVGAYNDEIGAALSTGVVYVFDRVGNSFNQVGILTGSLAVDTIDNFGSSVATSADGKTIIVGAYDDEIGATSGTGIVYVFNRQGNSFNQVGILTGSLAVTTNDNFGFNVTTSADGKTIIAGAYQDEIGATTDTGVVYVFDQTRDTYVYSGPTGNIGIGTALPTSKFEVSGTSRFFTTGQGDVSITHSSLVSTIKGASTIQLALGANNTETIRINNSNQVGIGTASPAFTADIAGDARITNTNKMRFGGTAGSTNFYIQYNSTTNSLDFVAG
jgi:glutamate synthase domain-containing protein 3